MDPDHAIFLTAHRLARRLSGHESRCGCEQCTLYAKLLGSDAGLRRALRFILAGPDLVARDEALEALTGETL